VPEAVVLAYLGGLVDGDGYIKITRSYRSPRIRHPYYTNVLGVSQLSPGPAVRLFASTLGGDVREVLTPHGTKMTRCELRGKVAVSAARHLAPFLLLKRNQALLFLEAVHWRPTTHGRTLPTETGHERVERVLRALVSVQGGTWEYSKNPLPLDASIRGYGTLTPDEMGWTRAETLAYLAGIMDSDGNFRICRRRVAGMRWPQYRVNVRCAQVSPSPAVQLLKRIFGGHISLVEDGRPNHRDLVAWSIDDRGAVPAIEALIPHLRVKWIDACLLLELRDLKSRQKEDLTSWVHANRWHARVEMRKRSYSSRQVAEFERVRQTLLALHAAGNEDSSTVPEAPG
jgi:hypothetical protein